MNFLDKIDAIMRRFWWTGNQEDNHTALNFRSWNDICQPKSAGGLGIKKLQTVNKSLVLHSAWMVVSGKDPFLTGILKSKYYPNASFLKSNQHTRRSVFWSSIQSIKHHVIQNSRYQIHEGKINLWTDPWCPI
ncbi:hypothetical protein BS78_08G068500 [Paspalum vaginatum]|nr:hypothetical protein BS78_08G068500 [Paspalum vaginatum]